MTSPGVVGAIGRPYYAFAARRAGKSLAFNGLNAILVVRLDQIGDVVMTSPFLRELRRNAPQAWITLVVKPGALNLVELCPHVNEVLAFDWRARTPATLRLHGRALRLAATRLWRRRFDMAVIPRWGEDRYHATYIAYFSGARRRVGHSERVCAVKREINAGFDGMLTDVLTDGSAKHEVERNLDVVRFLGGQVADARLEVWLDEEDRLFAAEALARHGVERGRPVLALAPGAGRPKKQWPIERFLELGRLILDEYQPHLLIVGGPEDGHLGERLKAELGDTVINLAGRTTLRQAAAALEHCRLTITNDSGPMHLAAAAGSAVVELSWHPRAGDAKHAESPISFGPWGVPHAVVQPEQTLPPCQDACESNQPHCILGVSVERALDAVRLLLSGQPAPKTPAGASRSAS